MYTICRGIQFHALRPGRSQRLRGLPCAVWLVLLLLPVRALPAQPIPEAQQLPIYLKLLTYDRTLWDRAEPRLRIGVLHHVGDSDSQANLVALVETLTANERKTVNNVSFSFTTISWITVDDLNRVLKSADIDVLYVTRGQDEQLDHIVSHTRHRGILTLAGNVDMVGEGLSVGIGLEDGRAQIHVNLDSLTAERHELESRVLRICKVVNQ